MPEFPKPLSISSKIWASAGEKDTPSTETIEGGWVGGEIPPHEYFNFLQNRTDLFLAYLEQQGIPLWDGSVSYLKDLSVVKGTSKSIYVAKENSINQNPDNDLTFTYWTKLIDGTGAISKDAVSSYMLTLLDDANASAALTTLGLTTVGKAVAMAADEAAARTAIGGDYFLNRAVHSGTQAISTVTNLQSTLDSKEPTSNKVTTLVGANDTTFPTSKAVSDALTIAAAGEEYQGEWNANTNSPTLVSSTGTTGHYYRVNVAGTTTLNGVSSWNLGDEVYFSGTVWLRRPNYFPSLTTDDITEGTKLYYTEPRVRGVVLTGISFLTNLAITASDNILQALGKLQAQITGMLPKLVPSGGTTGQALVKASGTDHDLTWQTISNTNTYNITDLGNRAVSGSESVNLDCSVSNYWNVSLNSSNSTGTLTLNIINLPSTTNSGFTGHIRIIKGGIKSIAFTVPGGKTWNWAQGVTPSYGASSNNYDIVMFHTMFNESKLHAQIVDSDTV